MFVRERFWLTAGATRLLLLCFPDHIHWGVSGYSWAVKRPLEDRAEIFSPLGRCVEYGRVALRSALWVSAVWWWQLHDPLQEDYSKNIALFWTISRLLSLTAEKFCVSFCIFFPSLFGLGREVNMTTPGGFLLVVSFSSIKWCRYSSHSFPVPSPFYLQKKKRFCCNIVLCQIITLSHFELCNWLFKIIGHIRFPVI